MGRHTQWGNDTERQIIVMWKQIAVMWTIIGILILVGLAKIASGAPGECFIVSLGDLQNATKCDNASGATDAWDAAVDWIIAADPPPALVYAGGDLVHGNDFHGDGADCYCQSRVPDPPEVCGDFTSPYHEADWPDPYDDPQSCVVCNTARAVECELGVAGIFCEYERARTWFERLDADADAYPVIFGAGNHDMNGAAGSTNQCWMDCVDFNTYFGPGKATVNAIDLNTITPSIACAGAADGISSQCMSQALTFDCGGIAMRWIEVAFNSIQDDYVPGTPSGQILPSVLEWAQADLVAHEGKPTILSSHMCIREDCTDPYAADYDGSWCTNSGSFSGGWVGFEFFDVLAVNPWVLVAGWCGHIRNNHHKITTVPSGKRQLGTAYDMSFQQGDGFGPNSPLVWAVTANGGAGTIQVVHIDAVRGTISSRAYSPYARSLYLGTSNFRYNDMRTSPAMAVDWTESIPMCEDRGRFTIPEGICTGQAPADCNCKNPR